MTSAIRHKLCRQCTLHEMGCMELTMYKQHNASQDGQGASLCFLWQQGMLSLGRVCSVPAGTGSILGVQVCSCCCAEALCTAPCRAWLTSGSLRT